MGMSPALKTALERLADAHDPSALAAAYRRLSARYRAAKPGANVAIPSAVEAAAYALARSPATHAAAARVFTKSLERLENVDALETMIDLGAGAGATTMAAIAALPSLRAATLVEVSPAMADALAEIVGAMPENIAVDIRREDVFSAFPTLPPANLVVASYCLGEIAPGRRVAFVAGAARLAKSLLVLVEPGTPGGFQAILGAREILIEQGFTIVSPCPGHGPCPRGAEAPCRFVARLARSRLHRRLKDGERPFEDESFSYLAAVPAGVGGSAAKARIIERPRVTKAGISFELCEVDGAGRQEVAARDKAAHRAARRLDWGDAFE